MSNMVRINLESLQHELASEGLTVTFDSSGHARVENIPNRAEEVVVNAVAGNTVEVTKDDYRKLKEAYETQQRADDLHNCLANLASMLGLGPGCDLLKDVEKAVEIEQERMAESHQENRKLREWIEANKAIKLDPLTQEAVSKIRGIREKEYGDKLTNFTDIANLQNAAHGMTNYLDAVLSLRTAESVAIDMICLKLARLRKSPDHYDTLVDLIGYVLCYRDIRRTRNAVIYENEEARFRTETQQQRD